MSRRYPLRSLVAASGLSEAALAQRVGLTGTTLKRARAHGFVESAADRYAVRAGLVPWLVWSDWLEDAAVTCEGCGSQFVPSRKGHRFCTVRCNRRAWDRANYRARYQADPEFAAAERERARAYREQAGKANRLTQAAYREANRAELAAKSKAYYQANRERLLEQQRERDRARRRSAA